MFGYPAMSTAPPRGRELNAPQGVPPAACWRLLSRGLRPQTPGLRPRAVARAPVPVGHPGCAGAVTCHPKEEGGAQPLLAVTKGLGTPMSLKSPLQAFLGLCGPLAARRGRPGKGRGSPAAQRLGEGPRSRPSAWMPGGVRSTPQGCEVSPCKLCFT